MVKILKKDPDIDINAPTIQTVFEIARSPLFTFGTWTIRQNVQQRQAPLISMKISLKKCTCYF
jgi:hypothetical protein